MPTFDPIFAKDPGNPNNIASNATITLFDPADPNKTPITLAKVDGTPLPNPITVDRNGMGPAFVHSTLFRVGWEGGGYSNYFTAYEQMHTEAVAAREAAETAGLEAGSAAAAEVEAQLAADRAAVDASAAAAAASEQAAKDAAALVGAPADDAIEAAIKGTNTKTSAALTATTAQAIAPVANRTKDVPLVDAKLGLGEPITKTYNPNPSTSGFTSSNVWSSVDATNLSMSFVVPRSGKVLVELDALGRAASGTALAWGLQINGADAAYAAQHMVSGVGAESPNQKLHALIVVDKLADGVTPLTPGKVVTLVWRHRSTANTGTVYTQYGAGIGAAIMKVTPLSDKITDRVLTPTVTEAVEYFPLWLCHDRKTIIGASTASSGIFTADESAPNTYTRVGLHTFAGGIAWVRELDNGELLVGTNPTSTVPSRVFVSNGWPADKASATFTNTLTVHDTATKISTSGLWGVSVYSDICIVAEYGPKASAANMAQFVYLSQDSGKTWETIFDVAAFTGETVETHMHGVAYDPWWDAIWVCYGDSDAAWGSAVSFDMGKTWKALPKIQKFTTIIPMENCVLWLTDRIGDEGVWRIPRSSKKRLAHERAHIIATGGATIYYVGTGAYHSRAEPGAPVTLAFNTGGISGACRALATYDGYTFREVWNDEPNSYINFGMQRLLGPTASNKYVARFTRGPGVSNLLELK